MGGRLGGDPTSTADPNQQRDIPRHMTSCSAMKAQRKAEERGRRRSWLCHLYPQATVARVEALLSRRWLNICLPMWRSERTPIFALLMRSF